MNRTNRRNDTLRISRGDIRKIICEECVKIEKENVEKGLRKAIRKEIRLNELRQKVLTTRASNSSIIAELTQYQRTGILSEGTKETAVNAVQYLLGAAAEYGIAVPTAGAGAPIGAAAETMIDAAFTVESISSAISSIDSIVGKAGDFKDILNQVMGLKDKIGGDLDGFYKVVVKIVRTGLLALGKGAQNAVKEFADDLKDIVEDMVSTISDAIGDAVKFLIPDATIGLAAAEAIQSAIGALAKNCFTVIKAGLKKAGKFAKYVTDPSAFPKFIEESIPKLVEFIGEAIKKLEETSNIEAFLKGGGTSGLVIKNLGPKGLQKIADILEEKKPDIVSIAKKITSVLIPVTFSLLAIMQILLNDEYLPEKTKKSDSKETEAAAEAPAAEPA